MKPLVLSAMRLLPLLAIALALNACTINASLLGTPSADLQEVTLKSGGEDKILMISIEGTITASDDRSLLGGSANTVEAVRRQLDAARLDPKVKGLLLRVNSPGGGATASDTILHELISFKEEMKVPVVAFFQDMAASGGYYVSMCADEIIAQPTTITGSIGVIMVTMDVTGLLNDLGIKTYVIRSGDLKAGNHPLLEKNEAHLEHMHQLNSQMYERFVQVILDGRTGMQREALLALADGRVFLGDDAKANGLIDRVGFIDDAIARIRELAGSSNASLVTYTTQARMSGSVYDKPRLDGESLPVNLRLADSAGILKPGTTFLYMHAP